MQHARDVSRLEPLLLPFFGVMVVVMTWRCHWYVVCPLSVVVWW